MKRVITAILVGGVMAGAVYGLAAGLGVSTSTFGSGSAVVAACQSTTLTANYTTSYQSTLPGYRVDTVSFTGLDTASGTNCANKAYTATLTGAGNASLGSVSGTTPGTGTSFSANFASANVNQAAVTGVHLSISG